MPVVEVIIINGPNLNLLGKREISIYGSESFESYLQKLIAKFAPIKVGYYQSNHEGKIIDKIQEAGFVVDGIVINPAAYTHTSIAIADCLKAVPAPAVEVHISNIYEREKYRHISFIKEACIHSVVGRGLEGYDIAIQHLIQKIKDQ